MGKIEKIAIISDIHGNLPALSAVLEDIKKRGIERIFCLGDLIGKGPSSASVVDMVRKNCEWVVKGNWDYYVTKENISKELEWHQNKLGKERLEYMKNLPMYLEFYISGKLVRLFHASPKDLFQRIYITNNMDEKMKLFDPPSDLKKNSDIVGYGDIHGAFIDNFKGKSLFNVGSVGNPLEIPQASYAIIEGHYQSEKISSILTSLVRVPYDIEKSIADASATDMPKKTEYIEELKTAVYQRHKGGE